MSLSPVPLIAQIFFGLLVASVSGAISYFFWRFLSKFWPDGIYWLGLPIIFFTFLSSLNGFLLNLLYFSVFLIFICIGGGFFHRRSLDSSKIKIGDSFLVLSSSFLSALIGLSIKFTLEIDIFMGQLLDKQVEYFYFLYLLLCPALVPALFWAWKSMKLQPGVDKHLES